MICHRVGLHCATLLAIATASVPLTTSAQTLSQLLRDAGWQDLVGTWVDADTQGEQVKLTYAWKIPDRLIESTAQIGDQLSVALMGVDASTGQVFHGGGDSAGGSFLGAWDIDDNGDALLELKYTTGEGYQETMKVRFHRQSKEAVLVTVESPNWTQITLQKAPEQPVEPAKKIEP